MKEQAELLRTVEILIKQLTIADQNFDTINDQLIIISKKFEVMEADIKMLKVLEERPLKSMEDIKAKQDGMESGGIFDHKKYSAKIADIRNDLQEVVDAISGWEPSPSVVAEAIVKAFPNISLGIEAKEQGK